MLMLLFPRYVNGQTLNEIEHGYTFASALKLGFGFIQKHDSKLINIISIYFSLQEHGKTSNGPMTGLP